MKERKPFRAGKWMIPVSSTAPTAPTTPTVPTAPTVSQVSTVPIPNVPAPSQFPPQPQVGGLDPISSTIMGLNTNPYLIGVFMLLLNLGGRFLSLELTKKQEAFLQSSWIRPIIFFTVVFIATRNLVAAFWITAFLFFILWVVANEHSPFCMIPDWCGHNTEKEQENYLKNVKKMVGME